MASFTAYASKMKAEGLSGAAIAAFNHAYNELASGTSGCIPESSLGKITTVNFHYLSVVIFCPSKVSDEPSN